MTPCEITEIVQLHPVLLRRLSYRERQVIQLRYGLGEYNYTLQDVAAIFKVTRERIRQIESKAIERILSAASTKPT